MSSKRGRSLAELVGPLDDAPTPIEGRTPDVFRTGPSDVASPEPVVVPINVLVTPPDRKRLRQLSLDTGLSLQKLGHEAWNRLLEARGLPPLEPAAASVPSGRSRAKHPS
jgi:hypothetical protein